MNENQFTFSLIHKQTKKYRDIGDDVSDDIMEWAVMCTMRDCLIPTQDWDQSLVSAKDWSKKWNDPLYN